jgi:hypothetical protein
MLMFIILIKNKVNDMKVIEYLNEHGVDKLSEEFAIKIREYPEDGIMILNYNMIDSPKVHPIVRECRSLILEDKPPFNVVSRSFNRFFNYGECPNTDDFVFNETVFFEKVDGSIINVYWWNNQWNVSTKSMAQGEAETPLGHKFKDIFCGVFDLDSIPVEFRDRTLIFEMVSPRTRVVKPYPSDDVYLIGARRRVDGHDYHWHSLKAMADTIGVQMPEIHFLDSYNDINHLISNLEAFDEGFIGVNYNEDGVHRIKFKNPSHLAIAHLRGDGVISKKRLALLVLEQDQEEYLQYFPEDRCWFQPYIDAFNVMMEDIKLTYDNVKDIVDQKEYALAVKDKICQGVLFKLRTGIDINTIFDNFSDNYKIKLIEGYVNGK